MNIGFFDADEHYYEAEDAFTRFASQRMKSERFIRWLTEADGKRKRLFAGSRQVDVIPNPTFTPITTPGIYHETLKRLEVGEDRSAAAYGKLEPIRPEYRDRAARVTVMDQQGVDKTLMFPTLGVTMEGFLSEDADMLYGGFHAFNRWLAEDWGFAHQGRIFAAPYLVMMNVDRAVAELDWVLKQGARLITIRPGPAYGRSPADPYFDPFWARVEEAGVLVTYHGYEGPSLQVDAFRRMWAAPPQSWRAEDVLLKNAIAGIDTFIMDTLSALILHNLFGRFPKIRVAAIELGSGWVGYLMNRLDHSGLLVNRRITAFGETLKDRPSEIFREKIWVAPFPEDDIPGLIDLIGADHVLMGSDWPHAEGTAAPADFARCLGSIDDASARLIMHDNIAGLIPG
jgi:predicted TIM-barrel fold metal-dependent hydrolase